MLFFLEVQRKLMSKANIPQLALSCIFVDGYRFSEYISLCGSWWACDCAYFASRSVRDAARCAGEAAHAVGSTYAVWSSDIGIAFGDKYSLWGRQTGCREMFECSSI
jgi:hypothetical protein